MAAFIDKKLQQRGRSKNSFCYNKRCGLPTASNSKRSTFRISLNDINSLSHIKWNCRYHIVLGRCKDVVGEIFKSLKISKIEGKNKTRTTLDVVRVYNW